MSVRIETYGSFREGREKITHIDYVRGMTLRSVTEMLNIDPRAPGIVKINDLTGLIEDTLDEEIPDGSCIHFWPFLSGG
jgi:hypothetical protein